LCGRWRARSPWLLIVPENECQLFQSAMPADGMFAARSHARISASPRFKGGYAKFS